MNTFLQENVYAIILFLLLIILLLIALIGVVIVKLLLSPKDNKIPVQMAPPMPIPGVVDAVPAFKIKKLSEETVQEKFFCENHPDVPSVGACLICEEVFCEKCLIEHEGLYFCKEHFKTFANSTWVQITDVKTTPNTPEDGLYIYHFKRHLWKDKATPSFVLTHYKINIEQDFIESFIQLNVREEEAEQLKKDIEEYRLK